MRKPRRNHSAKFKAMVALEASTEIKATPDQAPKIDRLTSPEFWELMNGGFLPVLKRLRKILWDFTYLCWKLTLIGESAAL